MTTSILKKRIAVFSSIPLIALIMLIAASDFTPSQNQSQVLAQSLSPTVQHQPFLSIDGASDGVQPSESTLLTTKKRTGPVVLLSTPTPTPCPKQTNHLMREIETTTIDELPGCIGNGG